MATQEKDQMCKELVRKLTMGEALEDTEKSHLAVLVVGIASALAAPGTAV